MIEAKIKDYLISNVEALTVANCFVGNVPSGTTSSTFVVISSSVNPLSDSHNSLAMKLSTPKGINEKSVAISIMTQSDLYESASDLIWKIYSELGSDDGGCIIQDEKQMYIIPNDSPFCEENNKFRLNFITRTRKEN